ncbi:hypothetical protein [Nostoc sp. 2RC]|uniref:hypothetical protein n=1 Tax=Nostoc sp. 2RC TaxID=2485484 RepID=UPI0016269A65|nr:hypothetical protein [Nostoc sp. 2RC]MBC1237142.1 hypothetical protein [Nostoc sp. 2RC]
MEPVTLTAVATAIATIVLTKALEKTGEKLGEAGLEASGKLIAQLRNKNKLPLLTEATPENTQPPLDYGKAVLELKAAADADSEIAQSVGEVEAAANADPQVAPKVQALANELNPQSKGVINNAKVAESIEKLVQVGTNYGGIHF